MHMMSLGEDCLFFFQIVAQGKAQCSSPFYRDVACVLDITSFYLPKLGLYITSSHSSPTRVVLKHPQRLGVFLRKMMAWTLKRLPPSLLEAPMDRRPRDLSLTTVWDHGTVDGLGWGLAALKKGTAPTSQPKKPKSLKICWKNDGWLGSWWLCFFLKIFGKFWRKFFPTLEILEVGRRWREIFLVWRWGAFFFKGFLDPWNTSGGLVARACLPIRQISSLPFLEVVNTRVSVGGAKTFLSAREAFLEFFWILFWKRRQNSGLVKRNWYVTYMV